MGTKMDLEEELESGKFKGHTLKQPSNEILPILIKYKEHLHKFSAGHCGRIGLVNFSKRLKEAYPNSSFGRSAILSWLRKEEK